MRVVIVGASSGLGRSLGIGLSGLGASVALLGRRKDRLDAAVEEAGGEAVAIQCDVTDADGCRSAIDEAARALGGIDALIYAAAIAPLARIADTDVDTWRITLDTNVVGASLVTTAALPHRTASSGTAIYLSSVSASQTDPWPGLGAYIVSKAALDKLVEVWRTEHSGVGFTRLVVGDCAGGEGASMTEMTTQWDSDLAATLGPVWFARGLISGALLPVEELLRVVDTLVRSGPRASMPSVIVTPRRPAV